MATTVIQMNGVITAVSDPEFTVDFQENGYITFDADNDLPPKYRPLMVVGSTATWVQTIGAHTHHAALVLEPAAT